MYFFEGQDVTDSVNSVTEYNLAHQSAAKKRCLQSFLNDLNAKLKEGEGFVYIQDPSNDSRAVYELLGVAKTASYSSEAEEIRTKEVKETEYYSTGYSGTIDSDGNVDIHEDIETEEVTRTYIDSIGTKVITCHFCYVLCTKENNKEVLEKMNGLTGNYNGYYQLQHYSLLELFHRKIIGLVGWIVALIDCLLCIYLALPLGGQISVIDYTSENNIFAFLKPQAFLFWPLFAVSIVLKIIALIPAFTFKRVFSKYLIYNYIMFPITLIAIVIMVDLANANEGWSFPAFALLIRYVVSLFFQTYKVIRTRDGITIPKKDYEDAKNFKRRFRDLKDYEDTLAAVKGLIHE